jgi:hypothetical protein
MENNVLDGRSAYTAITAETEPLASELYFPQFFSDCQTTSPLCWAWAVNGAAWHQEQVPTSSDTSFFFF